MINPAYIGIKNNDLIQKTDQNPSGLGKGFLVIGLPIV
jgi:hypothetical protein